MSYSTNVYKLNYMESLLGLKFILNTDVNFEGAEDLMKEIMAVKYFFK